METKVITNKRVYKFGEFDLMKAIAVLGLPIVHLLEEGIYNNYVSQDVYKLEYISKFGVDCVITETTYGKSI